MVMQMWYSVVSYPWTFRTQTIRTQFVSFLPDPHINSHPLSLAKVNADTTRLLKGHLNFQKHFFFITENIITNRLRHLKNPR